MFDIFDALCIHEVYLFFVIQDGGFISFVFWRINVCVSFNFGVRVDEMKYCTGS